MPITSDVFVHNVAIYAGRQNGEHATRLLNCLNDCFRFYSIGEDNVAFAGVSIHSWRQV